MEIVLKTARRVFYKKPCFLLTSVKTMLGEFWEDISKEAIDAMKKKTSPMEKKTEAYISQYVRSLERDSLSLFTQFCTGSSTVEPGSSIKVVLENQDDRNFVIRAAACLKIVYCPKNCLCYKQLKTACDGVLHSPTMQSMDYEGNENFD